ncbi:unnamed protein product [Blepharisma stoltei]|uniref:Calpain catalytic domain-containing protein n=1 Tax=Blepharisma stoltei TaxID=1481888 RepID=A0AAU9JIS8_9CILI|nr:unnamed protein product [Blepharisma stoltei]
MVTTRFIDVPSIAPEMGVFFIFSLAIFFGFMKKIKGDHRFIEIYIASRLWEFLKDPSALSRSISFLKFIILTILAWPIITLLCWTGSLLYNEIQFGGKYDYVLGISVFLICFSAMFFLSGALRIKWQGYKISWYSILSILLGAALYMAFQIEVLFLQDQVWFFGLSSIFIASNCIVIVMLIYIVRSKGGVTINTFINELPDGDPMNVPEGSIKEILENQKKDSVVVSKGEIYEFFTVNKADEQFSYSPLSGGIHALFDSTWFNNHKRLAQSLLYLFSLIVLAVYGILAWFYTEYEALGFLNFFLIGTTDIGLYLFMKSGLSEGSFEPTLIAVTCRLCIFIWTGEWWFLGYSLAYILFSAILFLNLIDVRFPLASTAIKQDLTKIQQKDISKSGEFVYLFMTITYCIVIVIDSLVDPSDIPFTSLTISGYDYPLWLIGITSITFTFILLGILVSLRLFIRKMKGVQDRVEYFMLFKEVDLYWIVITLTSGVIFVSGIAIYLATYKPTIMMLFFFMPVIVASYMNFYYHYLKNDHSIVMDVAEYNNKTKKKIEQDNELINRISEYQENLLNMMVNQDQDGKPSMAQMVGMTLTNKQLQEMKLAEAESKLKEEKSLEKTYIVALDKREEMKLKSGMINIDTLRESTPKLLREWKKETNFVKAFFTGRLHRNDYGAILSYLNMLIFLGLQAGIIYAVDGTYKYGASFSIAFFGLTILHLLFDHIYRLFKFVYKGWWKSSILKYLSIIFIFLVSWTGLAVGLYLTERLGIYAGFTISYYTCVAFIFICSSISLFTSIHRMRTEPIFFSPWIFPIYKYETKNDRLIKYNELGLMMCGTIGLIMIYGVICIIWVDPVSAGIAIGSLAEVLIALVFIFITGISPVQLGTAYKYVNPSTHPKAMKKAWLEAKENYLMKKGASRAEDFASYAESKDKINHLNHMAQAIRQKTIFEVPKKDENKAWRSSSRELGNLRDIYAEIHQEEKRAKKQYVQEIELMINFQLLILSGAVSSKSNEIMFLNSLFTAKAVELKAFGIQINLGPRGSIFEKYQRAKEQLEKLNPIQRIRFESIKEQYKVELAEERKIIKKRESVERKAMLKRMETAKKIHEQRQKAKQEQQNRQDIPIDEMVDSPEKYQKIVERFRATHEKFIDKQFPADKKSLGEKSSHFVSGWKRAGDESTLYEGGVSPEDIKQGALGDCYFLSALCVLGVNPKEQPNNASGESLNRVENIFKGEKPDPKCGAYIMKFYRNGDEVYIIVDDVFPINEQGEWAFARTVSGTELWPMLLEKAYAKLYGSYDSIAAGKVHYALEDLTKGAPEEIRLESAQNNSDALWSKMLNFYENGYLMGAGSPENPQGDLAVSENGIVQGHAYAILNIIELDGERLINLKNPHGQYGTEWRGDWCDSSFKWTKKFKEKLKFEEKDDGIFWMCLDDFVWEYKSLYICRIFDDKKWNKLNEIEGAWSGKRAAGLPCKDNPQVEFSDNPQYLIKVSKPCTAFIVLTQKEAVDMFKGKLPIIFMIFYGNQRVKDPSKNILKTSGCPTDLKVVSAEVPLDKGNSFTVVCASMYKGERGYGNYILNVTVDDPKATISELP